MKTFAGVVYVAFVVDTFSRRIVGWSAATVKETVCWGVVGSGFESRVRVWRAGRPRR